MRPERTPQLPFVRQVLFFFFTKRTLPFRLSYLQYTQTRYACIYIQTATICARLWAPMAFVSTSTADHVEAELFPS